MLKNHPRGLATLFFTEIWERFSYYGMRALLILYMTKELLYADEKAYGIYGAYTALVYATPVIGGVMADKVLGQRQAIILGAAMMTLGHFALAFPSQLMFYIALALLVIGNGFFKPNMAPLLGQLYSRDDPRRDGGFTIFYMGVNIGAIAAPLVCGTVGELVGWHYGFSLAGFGMLFGLLLFRRRQNIFGNKGLPPEAGTKRYVAGLSGIRWTWIAALAAIPLFATLMNQSQVMSYILGATGLVVVVVVFVAAMRATKVERERLAVAMILIVFSMLFFAFFFQGGSSLTLWADRNVDREILTEYQIDEEALHELRAAGLSDSLAVRLTALYGTSFDHSRKLLAAVEERLQQPLEGLEPPREIWIESARHFGFSVTASQLEAVNPLFIILFSAPFAGLWFRLNKAGREPTTTMKFALGTILLGVGFVVFAAGQAVADAALAPMIILLVGYALVTAGELCVSPVGLSMVTRLSPAKIVSFMMGTWFLSSAFANHIAALIATLTATGGGGAIDDPTASLAAYSNVYETVGYIAIGAGLLMMLLVKPLEKWSHPEAG